MMLEPERVSPDPSASVDNAREGFFDREAMESNCKDLDEQIVRFAFLTGWRKSEILGLSWGHVDFEAGTVRLEAGTTKNKDGRTFPFRAPPEIEELLRVQRERTQAATKAGGHPGARFHDLRRSAVRNFERAGISRSVAMKLSEHKTEAVYRRYAIADAAALEEGAAKLAGLERREAR